uniref:Integral membrane protein n=1 Tax=Moniliophthora roreri TaxID=221103 RepID=A0A0W0FSY0_MONRR
MSSTTPEELAPYLSIKETIVYPIVTLSAMYFVYGLYVLIFGTYVYITGKCQQGNGSHNSRLYLSLTITLFTLSTILVMVYTRFYIVDSIVRFNAVKTQDYDQLVNFLTYDVGKTASTFLEYLLPVLLNITADIMLIHRCYLIWGSKKRVGLPLIVASVLTNALGIISGIITTISTTNIESYPMLLQVGGSIGFAYAVSSVVINSMLTLLTAGRVWWIHRTVRAHDIHTSDALVSSVSRIILETGALYPIFAVVNLIVDNTLGLATPIDLYSITTLIAGIAPTLIMVRGKLGKNVESLQDHVSDICFTSQPGPRDRTQTQVLSIGDLSVAAVEFEGTRVPVRQMTNGAGKDTILV